MPLYEYECLNCEEQFEFFAILVTVTRLSSVPLAKRSRPKEYSPYSALYLLRQPVLRLLLVASPEVFLLRGRIPHPVIHFYRHCASLSIRLG